MVETKYRVYNLSDKPIHMEWNEHLLPEEVWAEFQEWIDNEEYLGETDEERAINKRKFPSVLLDEWITDKYGEGLKLPYGHPVKKWDSERKRSNLSYMFVIPSALSRREYEATPEDRKLGKSATRVIADNLGVEEYELKNWNKDRRMNPPRPGQKIRYYERDEQGFIVVEERQVLGLRYLERREIVQTMTPERKAKGLPEVYIDGILEIEEIWGEEADDPTLIEKAAERAAEKAAIQSMGEPEDKPKPKKVSAGSKEEIMENLGDMGAAQLKEIAKRYKIGLKGNEKPDTIRAKISAYLS